MSHAKEFVRAALTIAAKDLKIEARTGEIVTTAGFFAALVAIMASIAFYGGASTTAKVAPGAIWLSVAFASVLALNRTWQRERDDSALISLLVAPIPRASIFVGKTVGVMGFIAAVELIVVPIVALLFHVDLPAVAAWLVVLLVLGNIGVACTGTLFGAMTVKTRARELVLASVLFPLLSPTLLSGVAATRELLSGASPDEIYDYVLLLCVFDALAALGGIAVFGALVDD